MRRINHYTGAIAVFLYAHALSLICLIAAVLGLPFAGVLAVALVIAGDINIFVPYITTPLRRLAYKRLETKYPYANMY